VNPTALERIMGAWEGLQPSTRAPCSFGGYRVSVVAELLYAVLAGEVDRLEQGSVGLENGHVSRLGVPALAGLSAIGKSAHNLRRYS
jgi:hypothetical protein